MNKRDAAERLGVSTRLVERYASEGRLGEIKYVRGKTGKQADYDEKAIEQLKSELETPDHAIAPLHSRETGLVTPQDRERFIAALEALSKGPEQTRTGLVAATVGEKVMLTLADASALSSLSTDYLRKAIRAGKLKGKIIGKGFKIKRSDLDAYVRKL
jgi:excisionase family DNA binding protein